MSLYSIKARADDRLWHPPTCHNTRISLSDPIPNAISENADYVVHALDTHWIRPIVNLFYNPNSVLEFGDWVWSTNLGMQEHNIYIHYNRTIASCGDL